MRKVYRITPPYRSDDWYRIEVATEEWHGDGLGDDAWDFASDWRDLGQKYTLAAAKSYIQSLIEEDKRFEKFQKENPPIYIRG